MKWNTEKLKWEYDEEINKNDKKWNEKVKDWITPKKETPDINLQMGTESFKYWQTLNDDLYKPTNNEKEILSSTKISLEDAKNKWQGIEIIDGDIMTDHEGKIYRVEDDLPGLKPTIKTEDSFKEFKSKQKHSTKSTFPKKIWWNGQGTISNWYKNNYGNAAFEDLSMEAWNRIIQEQQNHLNKSQKRVHSAEIEQSLRTTLGDAVYESTFLNNENNVNIAENIRDVVRQYCRNRYLNNIVKIVSNPTGKTPQFVGKLFKCIDVSVDWRGGDETHPLYLCELLIESSNKEYVFWIAANDVIIPEEIDVVFKTLKKLKKREEKPDEYGNTYMLKLVEGEKIIYLSSALRTLLEIEDNDAISFAIDEEKQELYICKDKDGYVVKEGFLESNVEWRTIFNTFNPEGEYENGAYEFEVSHYGITDVNSPDYIFFIVSGEWYNTKEPKKKSVKEVGWDEPVKVESLYEKLKTENSYFTNKIPGYKKANIINAFTDVTLENKASKELDRIIEEQFKEIPTIHQNGEEEISVKNIKTEKSKK